MANWFCHLRKGECESLEESLFPAALEKQLIISKATSKNCSQRRFAAFRRSPVDFYDEFVGCPTAQRCFHEVVLESQGQKSRFDIDASPDQISADDIWQLVTLLVQSLIDVFASWKTVLSLEQHVLLYSSSGIDKYSYHVVVDGFYHRNSYEAKDLYSRVVCQLLTVYKLPERLVTCIDPAVYSWLQNFRIPGAVKEGTSHVKSFLDHWNFCGQMVNHLYRELPINERHQGILLLMEGLLTSVSGCHPLPVVERPAPPPREKLVASFDVDQLLAFLDESMRTATNGGLEAFSIRDVADEMITFNRTSPSLCPTCMIVHEAENPYLTITPNRLYWHCRRSKQPFVIFGPIPGLSPKSNIVDSKQPILPYVQPINKEDTELYLYFRRAFFVSRFCKKGHPQERYIVKIVFSKENQHSTYARFSIIDVCCPGLRTP